MVLTSLPPCRWKIVRSIARCSSSNSSDAVSFRWPSAVNPTMSVYMVAASRRVGATVRNGPSSVKPRSAGEAVVRPVAWVRPTCRTPNRIG